MSTVAVIGAPSRRGRPRRAALLGVAVAIAAVLPVAAPRPSEAATPTSTGPVQRPADVPYTVTADPTVNVDDGQLVTIRVKTDPRWTVDDIQIQLCRSGVVYARSTREDPALDFARGRANCPRVPISSNGSGIVDDSREGAKNAATPEGETLSYYVGAGTATWTEADGNPPPQRTLACDVSHPCSLVVEVLAGPAATGATGWDPWVFPVQYQNADFLQTCGGLAAGALDTAGSERLTDAYINWTTQQCHTGAQAGAAGLFSATGEGDAMQLFSAGEMDAVYSSLGYDQAAALDPGDPTKPDSGHRKAVAIPVALNATVMAVGNGEYVRGHKRPYESMKVTTGEAAHLVAQGGYGLDQQAIVARNPPMTGLFANLFGGMVVTSAKAESTTFLASRFFRQLAPGEWITPSTSDFRDVPGQARSLSSSFATSDPTFANVLSTQTGVRSAVRKAQATAPEAETGGMWLLTDRATSEALGLTPVQITNSRGEFVSATKASMTSAVPFMTADEQGVLLPDPNTKGAVPSGLVPVEQPYPLTFVEYVYAPIEPLVDDSCVPRTASQALLRNWLTYLIGPGQQKLPPGMEALPPQLVAQANEALAKVGASPSTRVCPPAPTTTTTAAVTDAGDDDGRNVFPGSGDDSGADATSFDGSAVTGDGSASGAADDGNSTSDGSVGGGGGGSLDPGAGDTSGAAGTTPPAPEEVVAENAAAGVPAFGGSRSSNGVVTVVTFLAIMLLVSAAAFLSSGRRRGAPSPSDGPAAGPPRTSA